ncbi:MAG: hypothetical protein OXE57_13020 [Alphaproteobacteria bacterium]|nr:hypothetical protein [Alphaproteobacteria bacterium]
MPRPFTVQCSYPAFHTCIVHVEADDIGEALEKALAEADRDDSWTDTGHCGDIYIYAAAEGAVDDPADPRITIDIPERFTEYGQLTRARNAAAMGSDPPCDP